MEKANDFIRCIVEDCRRYGNYHGIISIVNRFILYPGFRVLVIFRILSYFKAGRLLSYVYRIYIYKHKIDIPLSVKIGAGFMISHNGPVTINQSAIIGKHCTIHPNTLIGGMRGRGTPIVGDNVFIGNGAKIIGKVRIADYTFISPNAVVVKDTENGSVVAGVPAKQISKKGKEYVKLYS